MTEAMPDAGEPRRPRYWRAPEEIEGERPTDSPPPQPATLEPVSRRGFLNLLGGSLSLAGLGACTRQPREPILPYARQPEDLLPGVPLYYATALPFATGALGLLVESHDGRPTKIEGNPGHAASLGATDALAQASVLDLYDPDRAEALTHRGRISSWEAFETALAERVGSLPASGRGLRVLSRTVVSPTLAAQRARLREALPEARWHVWEPVHRDHERAGALAAFGRDVLVQPRLDRASVVLSLAHDFLGCGPAAVRLGRDFAGRRRVADDAPAGEHTMSRLYVVESRPTLTGAAADHRRALSPSKLERAVVRIAELCGVRDGTTSLDPADEEWVQAAARDVRSAGELGLVLAGRELSPRAHALVHAINDRLGGRATTYELAEPVEYESESAVESLRQLVADMDAGEVSTLIVLSGNPSYDAPSDLDFASAFEKVEFRVHVAEYLDETSVRSQWHVPEAHYLESWTDARAADGSVSIVQPLIAPLYEGHTAHEVVAILYGNPGASGHDIVRETWSATWGEDGFERRWRRALHDGLAQPAATAGVEAELRAFEFEPPAAPGAEDAGIELVLYPDESSWDGRFANNAWLQELPRPLSKLTWDNALLVAPATAERLQLAGGDVVELGVDGRKVEAAVWPLPGMAAGCAALSLGCGRTRAGNSGNGAGFDAYPLRTTERSWVVAGVELSPTGRRHELATTQQHHSMEGRDIVREADLAEFRAGGTGAPDHGHHPAEPMSLLPDVKREGNQWGMVIDLNSCIGCNACMVACQSENNIPVVGKEEVARGRSMHWIRVDRYFAGEPEDPETRFQPVPCMHCENAPCELVCPVNATVHGPEGLNEMVYNRCVGTRYCSNNCPYKVRRFNFLLYSDFETESLKMQRNPDVTVRSRGVMEKCTYCVQRINAARIDARKDGEATVSEGAVQTACQQVCPAQAITFGDIDDPKSDVSAKRKLPQHYALLSELNVRPRTTYLSKLTNYNPEIPRADPATDERDQH